MFKILIYVLNIFLAGMAMLIFDDDPTQVSLLEWSLYALILYSTWSLVKILVDLQNKS